MDNLRNIIQQNGGCVGVDCLECGLYDNGCSVDEETMKMHGTESDESLIHFQLSIRELNRMRDIKLKRILNG